MTFEELGIKTKPGLKRYATICPQCSKNRKKSTAPCLTVNDEVDNRWFKCNHTECGWSGNLDIMEKFDKVKKESKMPPQQRALTMPVMEYLKKRGLTLTTARKLKLYEFQQGGNTILAWPVFQYFTIVNAKFLNINWHDKLKSLKWWQLSQDLGTKIIPIGMHLLRTHDKDGNRIIGNRLIWTEGEIDMATWYECGYENIISVPQGAPSIKAKDFKKEFAYFDDPYVKSQVSLFDIHYLSVDSDEAGKRLAEHLGILLGKDKCRIVRYPIGYKDINEVSAGSEEKGLAPLGKKGVDECYVNIVSFPIKGIIKASYINDDLRKIREDGFTPGLKCGIPEVDRLFTVKRKLLMVVTGIPSAGKSTWIRWWVVELIRYNIDLGLKFAMFTPENRPVAREYAKIAEALTGFSVKKGMNNSMSDEQYRKSMIFVEKHFFIISPDKINFEDFGGQVKQEAVNTTKSIQNYLIYLIKTENIFGYIIDAWNKIEHEQPKYMSETNFISQQLDKWIDFNEYYDVFGCIIAHPRKIDQQGMSYKMPSLYDIKGTSAWKEKVDIGLVIHRYMMRKKEQEDIPDGAEEDEKWFVVRNAPTIIWSEKIRFEELGVMDKIKMEMKAWGQFHVFERKQKKKTENKAMQQQTGDITQKSIFEIDDEDSDDLPF